VEAYANASRLRKLPKISQNGTATTQLADVGKGGRQRVLNHL
jgi:hypothetical protein